MIFIYLFYKMKSRLVYLNHNEIRLKFGHRSTRYNKINRDETRLNTCIEDHLPPYMHHPYYIFFLCLNYPKLRRQKPVYYL